MADPPSRAEQIYEEISSPATTEGGIRPALAPAPRGVGPDDAPAPLPRVESSHPDHVRMFDIASNQVVAVPGHEATDAFTSGRFRLISGERVPVRLADGRMGTVDADKASQAIHDGASLTSPAALYEHQIAKQATSSHGAVTALASGFLRTALPAIPGTPLGADKLIQDLSADPEDVQAQQRAAGEAHPWLSAGGELAGLGAGSLAGGEANLTTGLGSLAEHGAAGLAGSGAASFLGRAAQRIAPMAARGGVEGALMGGQQATSEEALGDTDVNAEKVLAAIGHGALIGVGGAAVLGGAATAASEGSAMFSRLLASTPRELPAATASDVDRLAEKTFGVVPEGLGKAYVKAASSAAGGGADIIDEAGIQNLSASGRAAREQLANVDAIRDQASRDIRAHIDDMLEASRDVSDEARGPMKRSYLRGSVKADDLPTTATVAAQSLNRVEESLLDAAGKPREFGLGKMNRNILKYVGEQKAKLIDAANEGDAAEMFGIVDDTKRFLGRWTKSAQAVERTADPVELLKGRAMRDRLEGLYENLRGTLEDEGVWGKAGADQRQINAAWSRQIEAQRRFDGALTTETGRDPRNPWRNARGVDPAKADSYVRNLTNPNNDLTHQAVRDYVSSTKSLAEAIGSAYELPPEKAAQVERAVSAASKFDTTITKAESTLVKANQLDALMKAESASSGGAAGIAGSVLGGLVGHAVGHEVIGGAVGAALGAGIRGAARLVTKPGHAMMQLAQVERWIGKSDSAIARGVRGLLKVAPKAGEAGEGSAARAVADTRTARVVERDRTSDRMRRFNAATQMVRAAQAAPDQHSDVIAHRLGPLSDAAPKIANATAVVASRATMFLASKMPTPPTTDPLLATKDAFPPSSEEVDRFNRYVEAVDDPASVLHHMAQGKLTTEEVQAVRAVYPRMYEQMKSEILTGLTEASAKGEDPGYQRRLQIASLFDTPTDISMTPPYVRSLQGSYAPAPTKPPAGPPKAKSHGSGAASKPLSLASSTETRTQSLEQ